MARFCADWIPVGSDGEPISPLSAHSSTDPDSPLPPAERSLRTLVLRELAIRQRLRLGDPEPPPAPAASWLDGFPEDCIIQ